MDKEYRDALVRMLANSQLQSTVTRETPLLDRTLHPYAMLAGREVKSEEFNRFYTGQVFICVANDKLVNDVVDNLLRVCGADAPPSEVPWNACDNPECPIGCPDSHAPDFVEMEGY